MQTFLNEPTYKECAKALDSTRLNKQLLEARQLLKLLLVGGKGWANAPITNQWRGHENQLYLYALAVKNECKVRGIRYQKNWKVVKELKLLIQNTAVPVWWETEELKERILFTHRARLYEKDHELYKHYKKFWKKAQKMKCCERCNYFWPTHYLERKE